MRLCSANKLFSTIRCTISLAGTDPRGRPRGGLPLLTRSFWTSELLANDSARKGLLVLSFCLLDLAADGKCEPWIFCFVLFPSLLGSSTRAAESVCVASVGGSAWCTCTRYASHNCGLTSRGRSVQHRKAHLPSVHSAYRDRVLVSLVV